MSFSAAGLSTFFQNVVSDLKSSRRFQVSMLLWVPLIVTIGVFVTFLNEWHNVSHKYQEMTTSFIRQDLVSFPDVMMWSPNKNQPASPSCYQNSDPNSRIMAQPGQKCPHNDTDTSCILLPLSVRQSRGVDAWVQGINCTFTFGTAPNQNNIVLFTTPGGATQGSGWNDNWIAVRPNQAVSIHFEPSLVAFKDFFFFQWNSRLQYESTVFTYWNLTGGPTYQMSVYFRIPFTDMAVFSENTGFDSWMLCAAWGGGIFFFYLLHLAAFSIASLFLPNDSKVYGYSSGSSSEFQNIR